MRRRDFIILVGGAAAAWPHPAAAQQPDRMRRIGVLMSLAADDVEAPTRVAAFQQGLQELGWVDGRNVRIDWRWSAGEADGYRKYAAELIALAPDVILASGGPAVRALQQATRTLPIVFTGVIDPIRAGLVASLARPGGNVTGFTSFRFEVSGKWLELLKDFAPHLTRAAVIHNPTLFGQFSAIEAAAPKFGIELSSVDVRKADEIEGAITAFARGPSDGLIVTANALSLAHRELIITLAARHQLTAVYPNRLYITSGGLMSYGPRQRDQYRHAAGYVDRILRGTKLADLPVQQPTEFELVINRRTAKALGLTVPPWILAHADEVIE